jgi:1,4-dihydroxy-6-naphthoate synthase
MLCPVSESGHPLVLGFSSCPNDTFMFDALVHGRISSAMAVEVVMEDIEALNRRACDLKRALPVTKLSVAAVAGLLERYVILDSGAALGRGCGPLVVARPSSGLAGLADLRARRVAVPGRATTAFSLLRLFGPADFVPVDMRFDEIMPAVARGDVDAGLVIHESRFTYPAHGLVEVADLGAHWESDTGLPLPLGVIAANRALPLDEARAVQTAIRDSILHAHAHPEVSASYVADHARELDPEVCRRHIELYVNEHSTELGLQGRRAIEVYFARLREVGLAPPSTVSLWLDAA